MRCTTYQLVRSMGFCVLLFLMVGCSGEAERADEKRIAQEYQTELSRLERYAQDDRVMNGAFADDTGAHLDTHAVVFGRAFLNKNILEAYIGWDRQAISYRPPWIAEAKRYEWGPSWRIKGTTECDVSRGTATVITKEGVEEKIPMIYIAGRARTLKGRSTRYTLIVRCANGE